MNCPNCKQPYFWGEATLRSAVAANDVFLCRRCSVQLELIEDDAAYEISEMIFSVIRCWIIPLMLAGLPMALFGTSSFISIIGFLVVLLWQLREYEEIYYFLRVVTAENTKDAPSSTDG